MLRFFPAIGPDANAPVGELARALDRALHDPNTLEQSLVLNISAGWAPELGQPSVLVGDTLFGPHGDALNNGCQTREDPVGESVRWLLDSARRRDAREAPTVVHAAAGNRSDAPYESIIGWVLPHNPSTNPCGFSPALGQGNDVFYPAEWHRRGTCKRRADGTTTTSFSVAVAIAGSNHHEEPAPQNVPFADAAIHGPSQHVYVDAQGWIGDIPETEIDPECAAGADRRPFLTLPKAISGTSAATALASGIAARALDIHADENLTRFAAGRRALQTLNRRRMARMLWLTGERMCSGTTPTGLQHRRISMERFESALRHRRARRLLRCAGQAEPFGILLPGLLEDCTDELADVGLPEDPANCLASPGDLPWPPEPVGPCATYDVPCDVPGPNCPRPLAGDCSFPLCEFEVESPDRYSIGSLGPQPGDPWCPDCLFDITAAGTHVVLTADLATSIPLGALVTKAYVQIRRPDGSKTYASVSAYVPDSAWFAGNLFKATLTLPASVHGFTASDWSKSKATLVINAKTGSLYARNTSTLRIVP